MKTIYNEVKNWLKKILIVMIQNPKRVYNEVKNV